MNENLSPEHQAPNDIALFDRSRDDVNGVCLFDIYLPELQSRTHVQSRCQPWNQCPGRSCSWTDACHQCPAGSDRRTAESESSQSSFANCRKLRDWRSSSDRHGYDNNIKQHNTSTHSYCIVFLNLYIATHSSGSR